jgi:hypothetical protein
MPYSISGYPTTSSNEVNLGVTSFHSRIGDAYILGTTLSPTDHTAGSIYNKIFTNEIFINQGLQAFANNGVPSDSDKIIFGILENKSNSLGISSIAAKGYTLFIKYGNETLNATQAIPQDNIREKPVGYGGYIGVTTNGFTFVMNRYYAFAMGFQDFGTNVNGLTGCYTYYLINADSKNYGELIWRVAFSFGGTSGRVYDGPPLLQDGASAWYDSIKSGGPSFWLNNDGCMIFGMSFGDSAYSKLQSANPSTPLDPQSDGYRDPYPYFIDYVQ